VDFLLLDSMFISCKHMICSYKVSSLAGDKG
jgi:hypothetical protein